MANSLFDNSQYFTPDPRKKRRTDSFLPVGADNFTPSPAFAKEQPDTLPPTPADPNTIPINPQQTSGLLGSAPQSPNTQPKPAGGLYDYWKTPVMGKMPLDQFVQLTGMMANAFDPNGPSGRLGGNLAMMAGQANRDRMDYDEREQERAEIKKRYDEQRKDQRFSKFVDFASRSKNPTLAKTAYDQMKGEWEADFGKPLPDWDPEATPNVMKQLKEFREAGKENGWKPEVMKAGEAEILFGAGEISGKEYMDINYPKEAKEEETWSEPYETKVGGKKAIVQKSNKGKVVPVIQDKSTTVTVTPDVGRTKQNTVVYVDKVNGARHVVDLHNPQHVKWLEKYGPQLVTEKEFEKTAGDKAESDTTSTTLTYNPKTGKIE